MRLAIGCAALLVIILNVSAIIMFNARVNELEQVQEEIKTEHAYLREQLLRVEQSINMLWSATTATQEKLAWIHSALRIDVWTDLIPVNKAGS